MRGIRNDSEHNAKQEKKKTAPLIRYLVYFLILTTALTSVSMSRYLSGGLGGDSARVAKFNVVVTHTDTWNVNGRSDREVYFFGRTSTGENRTGTLPRVYTLNVENRSEVAVRARLVIDSADNTVTCIPLTQEADIPIGQTQAFTLTVSPGQTLFANDARMHFEYEQID